MVKKCGKCEIEKNYSEFHKRKKSKDGLMSWCKCCAKKYCEANKEIIKERNKEWRQDNKEYLEKYKKQYRQENKEHYNEYKKQYRQENKDSVNEYYKQYTKKRKKTDPLFKMSGNLRSRTSQAFKRNGYSKNTKTQQMLGVSWDVCKAHIENQFTKGMNWDNYGEWHIDHIIPLASANTEKELIKLCHYSNLQPLWAEDNMNKGSKIEPQQIKLTI